MTPRRPLYHSYAWAYDEVVANPGGPSPAAVNRAFRRSGLEEGARIVDAGCGTGRDSIELARAGFRVTGIDRSPELVGVAEAKAAAAGSAARFMVADLRSWRPEQLCDGVLCRGVLNDLVADADRRAALANMARMLASGGPLLLDVRDWKATAARYVERPVVERTTRTERGELKFRVEATMTAETRTLHLLEQISVGGETEEFHFAMRCWLPDELNRELQSAGFNHVEISRGDEGFDARADRLVAVAVRAGRIRVRRP